MLNYPFPYEKPDVAQSFVSLRDLLLSAVNETDEVSVSFLGSRADPFSAPFTETSRRTL